MASQLRVDAEKAFNASHAVSNDAEELRDELRRIEHDWDNLSSGWHGTAASAYTGLWQEWYEGASALVHALAESSRRLGQAAVSYQEQDVAAAQTLTSAPIDLGL